VGVVDKKDAGLIRLFESIVRQEDALDALRVIVGGGGAAEH
jgi:hypothetical protein